MLKKKKKGWLSLEILQRSVSCNRILKNSLLQGFFIFVKPPAVSHSCVAALFNHNLSVKQWSNMICQIYKNFTVFDTVVFKCFNKAETSNGLSLPDFYYEDLSFFYIHPLVASKA